MSTEKQEQGAMEDVLREYERYLEDLEKRCLWHPTDAYLRRLLERVRGAWKHERRAWGRERVEIATRAATQAVKPTNEKIANSPAGNAAALREALIKALTLIHVCDWPPWVSLDGVAEVVREIDSALDKPPRQCDVGTAEEQEERFKHFCASNYSACDVDMECCRCPLESEKASCEFAWAQMPYAEKKGLSK